MVKLQRILLVLMLTVCPLMLSAQSKQMHTVQRGETFALVAQHYGVTEQELKNANPGEDICYAGLKLSIPAKSAIAIEPKTSLSRQSKEPVATTKSIKAPSETTNHTPSKKKNSFWKNFGTGALIAAGVVAGVAVEVSAAKNGNSSSIQAIPDIDSGYSPSTSDYEESNHSQSSNKQRNCKYCHGTGKCTPRIKTKMFCNGTGMCQFCMGVGWTDMASEARCVNCSGTKYKDGRLLGNGKCNSCKGTGKCKYCKGTGKM